MLIGERGLGFSYMGSCIAGASTFMVRFYLLELIVPILRRSRAGLTLTGKVFLGIECVLSAGEPHSIRIGSFLN